MTQFPPHDPKKSFSQVEEQMLSFWKENNTFQKSIDSRSEENEYVFFDGPPFATGTPHYGHILAGTIKDAVARYWTQKGYRVNRKFGWDCHGVPVEFQVEKEYKIGGKPGIEKMGTAAFNDLCKGIVMRCADEWEHSVERMGRFVDFKNDYKTMDTDYIESVWSVFKELWDKGYIYEGEKVVPYSPKLGSPLSNFEANLNYKKIKDKTAIVKFAMSEEENTYFLAWTTTPWTLPSNLALCVNPDLEYVKVKVEIYKNRLGDEFFGLQTFPGDKPDDYSILHKDRTEFYIVAKSLYEIIFEKEIGHKVISEIKGADLVGKNYIPFFPFFPNHEGAFRVLSDDFVSDSDGTGIVHLAPNFGEDDARVCFENGIKPLENPIDENGYFSEDISDLSGMYFRPDEEVEGSKEKNANDWVLRNLKESGKLFKQDQLDHEYPFCWRTDCALMYRGIKTWFVDVQKIKATMIAKNKNINWIPEYLQEGRFGKILENAPDWAISRNRYWGAPIPVWRCEKCDHIEVVSEREKLEEKGGEKILDLHKQFVDDLSWGCEKCDGEMKRIPEVLDCWFESGAMPYASRGVHFQKDMSHIAPADFIAEGLDQTRGWFYTLHVLGCALTEENIYKNVITNGIILAEDGQKMSKSKKNYPDPSLIFDKYGADAMRFYLLSSPAVRAESLRFSEKGVEEVLKNVMIPLQNVYAFFSTYANIDGWTLDHKSDQVNDLDKWILSELEILKRDYAQKFEEYKLDEALKLIPNFLDGLTNWYIRRSRDRFWESGMSEAKKAGYTTLHEVMSSLAQLLAPASPFIADFLWKNLQNEDESVHLSYLFPVDESRIDSTLSEKTHLLREIITLSAAIRSRQKIKRKQPLQKLQFALASSEISFSSEEMETLKEEANVKEIIILDDLDGVATQIVKPDARKIGKKFGKDTQVIIQAGKAGDFKNLDNGQIDINGETLEADEYEVAFECSEGIEGEGNQYVVVLMDTQITHDLMVEGLAREMTRNIQELRKTSGFEISDRISVSFSTDDEALLEVIEKHGAKIAHDILSPEGFIQDPNLTEDEMMIDDKKILISITKK